MGHRHISNEIWAQVRAAWEADPRMSFKEAGEPFDLGKATVHARAHRDGWKKLEQPQAMVQRAHARADAAVVASVSPEAKSTPSVAPSTRELVIAAREEKKDQPTREPTPDQRAEAEAAAIDLRAKLIERHRKEWDIARKRVYEAANGNDFEKAKLGKITAEAIKIIQEGERKAWGIDLGDEKEVKVIIERKGGGAE